jgi:uncharacterized protein
MMRVHQAGRVAQAVAGALLLVCLAFAAVADVAVPALTGRVVDLTGTLSAARIAELDSKLQEFEARKGSQVAVLMLPTTAPETIEQYSLRVAEQWKIGRKKIDDGAILVIAKNDRALRIEVGYGLEGALTDVTAKRIIDEVITPKFRSGDFDGGVADGVDRMLRVIDGEPLPAPQPRAQPQGEFGGFDPFNPVLIIFVLVFGGILRGIFGRLFGSLATGGVVGVVAWFLIGSLAMSAVIGVVAFIFTLISSSFAPGGFGGGGSPMGRGGWSGGSSSGSSGGGFSGGGGSFGGGGASGRW